MFAEVRKEHEWLQRLVGEWTWEAEGPAEPGKEPETLGGTETVRSLGGIWFLLEGEGRMCGSEGTAQMVMTLGYDAQKGHYVGTWIGTMVGMLWVYERGDLDESGNILTLEADGPSMSGDGSITRYRDIIEFQGDDVRLLRSQTRDADGEWREFMQTVYRRKS